MRQSLQSRSAFSSFWRETSLASLNVPHHYASPQQQPVSNFLNCCCCSHSLTMFYSQIILAKKGPLAKVWLAAHFGDKKLNRPQIFACNVSDAVEHIGHPAVPLALRVSGHLLLGIVRIYSRKVHYLYHDVQETVLKIKSHAGGGGKNKESDIDRPASHRAMSRASAAAATANTAALQDLYEDPLAESFWYAPVIPPGMAIADEDWIPVEDDDDDEAPAAGLDSDPMLHVTTDSTVASLSGNKRKQPEPEEYPTLDEDWAPFEPDDEDQQDDGVAVATAEKEPAARGNESQRTDESHVSDIEMTRAAILQQSNNASIDEDNRSLDTAVRGRSCCCYPQH
jgi:cohesin complex subunit SCC1